MVINVNCLRTGGEVLQSNRISSTALIVGLAIKENGSGCLDEEKCIMCGDARKNGKKCPFHSLHRNAMFFKNHEAAFTEGRQLYLEISKEPDAQNLQGIVDFLLKLGEAESSCMTEDLLSEYQKLTDKLMRQEEGPETLRKIGREKAYTVMYEFFQENFYAFLLLRQNPQKMLSLFGDFIERRMVPQDLIGSTVNPLEYNKGLNEILSIGTKVFEEFVRQNVQAEI